VFRYAALLFIAAGPARGLTVKYIHAAGGGADTFATFQAATAWLKTRPQPLSDDYEFRVSPDSFTGTCTLEVNNANRRRVWFHAAMPGMRPEVRADTARPPYAAMLIATPRTRIEEINFRSNTSQNPSFALRVLNAAACTLAACDFVGTGAANWLELQGAASNLVTDCRYAGDAATYAAFYVDGASDRTRIANCRFTGATGNYGSIYIGSRNVTVDSCFITPANAKPGIVGVGTCRLTRIRGCDISNANPCIALSTADSSRIEGCRLSPIAGAGGVFLNSCRDLLVAGCSTAASPKPGYAIQAQGSSYPCDRLKVESLFVRDFAVNAIQLAPGSGGCIRGCEITGAPTVNTGCAITFQGGCRDDTIIGCRIFQRGGYSTYSTVRLVGSGPSTRPQRCVIADNFLFGYGSSGEGVLNLAHTDSVEVVYNTILTDSVATCVLLDSSTAVLLENNIVANRAPVVAGRYCYDITTASTLARSDFNDLYQLTPGNRLVRCFGVEYATLAAWQAAPIAPDPHSVSGDPMLTRTTPPLDLHLLSGSPCIGRATPFPGIRYDIDGDARDTLAPDIGADEYAQGAIAESAALARDDLEPGPTLANGSCVVSYSLRRAGQVRLELYDATGRRVLTLVRGVQPAGRHAARLAAPLPRGVYLVRLLAGGRATVRKLVIS
jgi:hypothetical protein